jgi:hypothetical protein
MKIIIILIIQYLSLKFIPLTLVEKISFATKKCHLQHNSKRLLVASDE